MTAALLVAILLATLVAQALRPQARLLIVCLGAALTGLASTLLGVASTPVLLAGVPWGVLVMLVALGLLAEMLAASRIFAQIAVALARYTGNQPVLLLAAAAAVMFAVSALVNNLTALVLVLPPLLVQLKLMEVDRRFATWMLGLLLVACNLGGAATPIGDFPAILMLGQGVIGFGEYLVNALPAAGLGLFALLGVVLLGFRPARDLPDDPQRHRLGVAVLAAMHRGLGVEWRILLPAGAMLLTMLAAWITLPLISGITAELICWLGVLGALLSRARLGERLLRTRIDVEAALFLLSLFIMVGAVGHTGFFTSVAGWLTGLPLPPLGQLMVFLVVSAVLTGIFSAGPSMAALLQVAPALAATLPPAAVYVGLALAVCAGSSLFLTAATSGPLAQAMVERAGLRDRQGAPIRFGSAEFLPVGLTAFAVILAVALGAALMIATMPRG
jgi:Na+/H+ antiporter NhaD/arsenite permease-like protein